jgi:hypothetical protein
MQFEIPSAKSEIMFFLRKGNLKLNNKRPGFRLLFKQQTSNIPFSSCVFLVLVSGSLDYSKSRLPVF